MKKLLFITVIFAGCNFGQLDNTPVLKDSTAFETDTFSIKKDTANHVMIDSFDKQKVLQK